MPQSLGRLHIPLEHERARLCFLAVNLVTGSRKLEDVLADQRQKPQQGLKALRLRPDVTTIRMHESAH